MDHVSIRVSEHLNLNVPGSVNVLFDVHRIITKGILRFALRGGECRSEIARGMDNAHALTTTARRRLQQHGKPKRFRHSNCRVNELVSAVASHDTSYRAALDEIEGELLGPGTGE